PTTPALSPLSLHDALPIYAAIARHEDEIASGDVTQGAGDDPADAGAKTYEREREIALTLNARDLVAQNERAIARIDAGTYGVCEDRKSTRLNSSHVKISYA